MGLIFPKIQVEIHVHMVCTWIGRVKKGQKRPNKLSSAMISLVAKVWVCILGSKLVLMMILMFLTGAGVLDDIMDGLQMP